MSVSPEILLMLNQLNRPAFLAKTGRIVAVNEDAATMTLTENTPVEDLLCCEPEECRHLTEGSALYTTIAIGGISHPATVTAAEGFLLFMINDDADRRELQALSLAASQLSMPISEISLILNRLSSVDAAEKAKIKQNLYRLQRIIGNMSDAISLQNAKPSMGIRDMGAFLSEITEKARTLLADRNIQIDYTMPKMPIFAPINEELMARAIYNLISNAAKFAPDNHRITLELSPNPRKLYISVKDDGAGIQHSTLGNVFQRYTRKPGLEDPRYGLGVGLTLVHSVAAAHGGTVLVENLKPTGTKITMTISLKQKHSANLKSPIFTPDIYGGQDQAMIELSDVLSYHHYMDP